MRADVDVIGVLDESWSRRVAGTNRFDCSDAWASCQTAVDGVHAERQLARMRSRPASAPRSGELNASAIRLPDTDRHRHYSLSPPVTNLTNRFGIWPHYTLNSVTRGIRGVAVNLVPERDDESLDPNTHSAASTRNTIRQASQRASAARISDSSAHSSSRCWIRRWLVSKSPRTCCRRP